MKGRAAAIVKAGRLFQKTPLHWLRPIESIGLSSSEHFHKNCQMLFLMALPRSGSTLTYQSLIHALQPRYLSNLGNALYQLPYWGTKVSGLQAKGYTSDFASANGFVSGLSGPAEGLRFWTYWLGMGLEEQNEISKSRKLEEYIRRVFFNLTSPAQPYLTGYLGHVLYWKKLKSLFPNAIFIHLHRDPISNAHSIYRIRRKSPQQEWFSLRPSECRDIGDKCLPFQAAAQVYWLNRKLEQLDAEDRVIQIAYEDLCRNPNDEVDRVIEACNTLGLRLKRKNALPDSFDYKISDARNDLEAFRIQEAFAELENLKYREAKTQ